MAGSNNDLIGSPQSNDNTINFDLNQYKYEISFGCIFNSDNSYLELKDAIVRLTIHSLYEEYVYPVIQAELIMNRPDMLNIQRNFEEIKFKINIKRCKATEEDKPSVSMSERFVNNKILLPIDMDMNVVDQVRNKETAVDNDYKITLDMMPQELLEVNKSLIGAILNNVTMEDVIYYCYGRVASSKKLLFNKPDNVKVYKQVILPSLNLTNTIEYLQKVYGIYSSGIRIYFDFNKYYLLSKDVYNKEVVGVSGEHRNVYVYLNDKRDKSMNKNGSANDKPNNRYVIELPTVGNNEVKDVSSREIKGESIKFLSNNCGTPENRSGDGSWKAGLTSESKGGINSNVGNKKQRLYYNNYSNPYNEEEFITDTARNIHELVLPVSGLDLDVITPNKNYYIEYTNKDYKLFTGSYHLTNIIYSYSLESNTNNNEVKLFNMNGMCAFSKLPVTS